MSTENSAQDGRPVQGLPAPLSLEEMEERDRAADEARRARQAELADPRARKKKRKRKNNPTGEMSLKEHLIELRNRIIIAGIAVLLGTILGFVFYNPLFRELIEPVKALEVGDRIVTVAFDSVTQPFDIMLQVAMTAGIIVSSPVWLYQVWAFIVPGLKKTEKKYALGFIASAVPLFIAGVALGWIVMPEAARFFIGLSPPGTDNIISANIYIPFITRLLLAFGAAMVLPVVLVGLNMIGVLPGRTILKHWRITVFVIALISAIAAPGGDALTMMYLAIPLLILFGVAIGLCLLGDRRRDRKRAQQEQEIEASIAAGQS